MIAPRINKHVVRFGHVARDALCAGRTGLVVVVCRNVVFARRVLVAGGAELVAFMLQSR